jgi:Tol biopolymer transport system component
MKNTARLMSVGLFLAMGLWACQDQVVTPDVDPSFAAGGVPGKPVKPDPPPDDEVELHSIVLSTEAAATQGVGFNLEVTAMKKKNKRILVATDFNGTVNLSTTGGGILPETMDLVEGTGTAAVTLYSSGFQTVTVSHNETSGDLDLEVADQFTVSGKIAYCSERGGGSDLWILEGDQAPRRLTSHHNDKECNVNYPAAVWSPDGSRIAFWSMVSGENHVWVANADGTGEIQVSGTRGSVHPSWSPNGEALAYIVGFENAAEVYVRNSDGTGDEIQLTSNIYRDNFPVWSPDGTQIIWSFDPAWDVSDDIGIGVITLEFEDGHLGDLDYLTGWVEEHFTDFGYVQPRWSSASDQIAVWGRSAEEWECGNFFVTDPLSMDPQQITFDRFCFERPGTPSHRWDPLGETLAVTGYLNLPDLPFGPADYDGTKSQVYLVPSDGSGATAITDAPGNNHWGEWLPGVGGRTFIVFQSTREGVGNLMAIDVADWTLEITLTDVLGNEGKPAVWVPSG